METLYMNTNNGQIDSYPSNDMDYGIKHFNDDGSEAEGMEVYNYQPTKSPIKRIKYLEEFGPIPASMDIISKVGGMQSQWNAPTVRGYINCIGLWRRFILSNRIEKKMILITKMGFDDSGMAAGESAEDSDAQFLYRFSTEPTQIELYVSSDELGAITEINRFHNSKMQELNIPLNPQGLLYLFFQVFTDLNKVDFNKFNPDVMTNQYKVLASEIMNLEKEMPSIDELDILNISPLNENNGEATEEQKNILSRIFGL